jgi:hypothetical protein
MHASTILDNRLVSLERWLRTYQSLPINLQNSQTVSLGFSEVDFFEKIRISEVDEAVDLFKIDLTIEWMEKENRVSLTRSTLISDFGLPIEN